MNKIMGYNTGIVDEWENVFELAMIVPGFAYYANYEESDETGKLQALYISDKMKENIDLLRESGYFDS